MNKERSLFIALILTATFLIAEVAGGIVTGSLALLSDAAHMLTDVTALVISLLAIQIGKRPADPIHTFGHYRFEILAAVLNTILLFLVAIYIFYEAYQRLQHPPEIYTMGMLVIAGIGLIVNLVAMQLLTKNKDKSINIKSAYLEVWSDMLGSIGVIVAAFLIRLTKALWIDSAIAVLIALWVLPRTWILLKESINVLLEGVPVGLDLKKLETTIKKVDGILDVHELHVWSIMSNKISLTAHVVIDEKYDCETLIIKLRQLLANDFKIYHTTVQHEYKKCSDDKNSSQF